ncbi:N-formylglutamate amidohydrolase [Reichenbachiella ulvae]|uniref:N-formylglutamate amidohydrolase n=1 Tax=Reichenbachiella ulvae TaxID=2980104 RepID=A0ABT3D0E8_9BACT|nr:N-formylglutamate amidohydrolase [Reichenbachiella ulvae]MCV9389377.1 N-formylglutamate amidohydrolase [Reichenbachiella ulvae]
MKGVRFVVSCEHATNDVPEKYKKLFEGAEEVLQSHRGWDPGALEMTLDLAERLEVQPHLYPYTRLLIEPNRSLGSPQLFSEYSIDLSEEEKQWLVANYYQPYRNRIEEEIEKHIQDGYQVIHLSMHSFTPVWKGKEREVEIGLLFDDQRSSEKHFCERWLEQLQSSCNHTAIPNEPYHGADDGLTTYLRTRFSVEAYLGIEIEVSQKFGGEDRREIVGRLNEGLVKIIRHSDSQSS